MIIVNILGGLGNQMFQYALYRSLLEKKNDVKYDLSGFGNYELHNGYELNRLFNITENIATKEECTSLKDSNTFLGKVKKKVFGSKKTHVIDKDFKFDPSVFELNQAYLDGYWQSEKYFTSIEDIIRKEFTFKLPMQDPRNKEIVEKMKTTNSVSLHVRRGDYVTNPSAAKVHGNICTLDYYEKAIKLVNNKVQDPVFFVFSDDIEWAKENLNIEHAEYIDWNKGENSYLDMQLMSNCKNNIIANSSFSWWGAWLNSNKEKTVIAPSRWFNDPSLNTKDIVPNNWLKIEV